ncbi:glycerophosphodiester phosphodiesterase family protein [Arthrobacter zhaoxinii]|uniref:Glycerophosphodiester phosphodiesterase family protein n=1 Tax=Arthrobacter zhaoxinii TaxID=2964616 RepID=A0ABY5YR13_9MICC|nr:glycerophosphodiester phosphodiesterase family protein [Arthrobacter zhaoxinii]UWX96484.1 glycerophosphodiester phosphodiesterase family protein [Arthrobacter zhaoxinii]
MIAHRGHSTAAPENTLPAFAAAAAAGAAMIETDIRLTADGTAVLLHDADLRRTTNLRGRVDRTPSARLAGADAGAWFSESHRGVPVPTLGDTSSRSCPTGTGWDWSWNSRGSGVPANWSRLPTHCDRLAVFPWTLDLPAQWIEALEAGADGIITNRPGALAAWANTRNGNWTAGAI